MSDQSSGTADAICLPAADADMLLTIADLALDFVVNWGLLATADFAAASERLDCLAEDLLPFLRTYEKRFPPSAGVA